MRRKKERSMQGQTNKQGKATQHTHIHIQTLHENRIVMHANVLRNYIYMTAKLSVHIIMYVTLSESYMYMYILP